MLTLLSLVSCRDFELSRSGLSVWVSPPVANAGAKVSITVSGSAAALAAPQVTLLGTLVPLATAQEKAGTYTFVYTVTGHEPEGLDLVVEAQAGSERQSAAVRFDFTPPGIDEVVSSPALAKLGEAVQIALLVSEPLSSPPQLQLQGRALACAGSSGASRQFQCSFTPQAGDASGWQVASAALVDPAGNTAVLDRLGLSLVIDEGQALAVAEKKTSPARAAKGQPVTVEFSTTVPLAASPAVSIGGRPATPAGGPDRSGKWTFVYAVTGAELGPEPKQAEVPVEALADGVTLALDPLILDFRPPAVDAVRASPAVVGAPGSKAPQATLTVVADEDLSGLSASLQARPLTCRQGADAKTWECEFVPDGTEAEGPQRVAFWAADLVGNTSLSTREEALVIAFECRVDPAKLHVVGRAGRPWAFSADPGACAPGSTLQVRNSRSGEALVSATAAADGSVAETGSLGEVAPLAEARVTDPAGNVCAWAPARPRFYADTAHRVAGGPTAAWSFQFGTAVPELAEFAPIEAGGSSAALAEADLDGVGAAGGARLTVTAPAAPALTWTKPAQGPVLPSWTNALPLVYVPGLGVGRYDPSDGGSFFWSGTQWKRFASMGTRPAPVQNYAFTFDPLSGFFTLFGGITTTGSGDGYTYLAQFGATPGQLQWSKLQPSPTPTGRYLAASAFDRAARSSLFFGGKNDSFPNLDETWTWDGQSWAQQRTLSAPPGRYGARMAYDAHRQRTVLFGGVTAAPAPSWADACWSCPAGAGKCYACDTWEWTGSAWVRRALSGPAARANYGFAWHEVAQTSILFGGQLPDPHDPVSFEPANDTWALESTSWRKLSPGTSPPAVANPGMAYDARRGRVVVFGGLLEPGSGGAISSELWELTEEGLFPGVLARLSVPDLGQAPSSLAVRALARGQSPRAASEGALALRVWDPTASSWVRLVTAEPSQDLGEVVGAADAATAARLVSGSTLHVLVTGAASSSEGASELEVDLLEVQLDW